ncbi:hypothetical protein OYT88_20440 [Sporolactobacillus sp. CQH2019]|jgi:hypothetical protein|uniref:hypothetical protein n=1 Tax=Sporolactobacillus sp. CQH2019 TaxID=3023512 RepID=UPI002368039D|nr:hypothetical protein [Sporolactobacillus sp. CQH2019]MBE6087902.1 hypothetical protein [Clostridium beijerinckii]MDD9150890.1 hypothetical protein [Sporolactobacillus sp. CQH2019]
MKNIYEKKVAKVLNIYMKRTGIKWDDLKNLILKNETAIENLDEKYLKYTNSYIAANELIKVTLLRDIGNEDLDVDLHLRDEDNELIELLKSEKLEFKISKDYLDKFKIYCEYQDDNLNKKKL